MKIRFLSLGNQEVDDAVRWYEEQAEGLSRNFLDELDRVVRLVKTYPRIAKQINTVPVSTSQGFKNLIPFAKTDVDFLFYLLTTQKQGFISLCGGSTFLEIGKTQLVAYQVRLPSVKAEQTAIAEVLSDMDAELAGLEHRREKTRALKQAMMQELLTGRTRLI
jgi:restriction endonuclease S subunit